ncbi:MAG: class I SAM-dependent methyltransferase [Pedobacter sp.]
MKEKFKNAARAMTKNDFIWELMFPFVRIATRFSIERAYWIPTKNCEADNTLRIVFADLKVKSGPFKNMLYPEFTAHGSYIFPKLLGSYEQELHPVIEKICKNDYSEILDIGCAEGYYAVGLALKLPKAKVYAFDIDEKALGSCKRMATSNGVYERIVFEPYCDSNTLKKFIFKRKGLIVCDCEGYETELFVDNVVDNLTNCDLLIELHDCLIAGITDKILSTFSDTHVATLIFVERRNLNNYSELKTVNKFAREYALYEGRPSSMQWVYLATKKRN